MKRKTIYIALGILIFWHACDYFDDRKENMFYTYNQIKMTEKMYLLVIRPDTNMVESAELLLYAGNYSGLPNANRVTIKFDLKSVPDGATIELAYLSLYFNNTSIYGTEHVGDNGFVIQRIISPWNQYSICWNSQPTTTEKHQVFVSKSILPNQDFQNINVTELVQDMVNDPINSFGFFIKIDCSKL